MKKQKSVLSLLVLATSLMFSGLCARASESQKEKPPTGYYLAAKAAPCVVMVIGAPEVISAQVFERFAAECDIVFITPASVSLSAQVIELSAPPVPLTLTALAPAPPDISIKTERWPLNEKPLGKLKNKHHSPWLFHPLRVC